MALVEKVLLSWLRMFQMTESTQARRVCREQTRHSMSFLQKYRSDQMNYTHAALNRNSLRHERQSTIKCLKSN